MAFLYDLLVRKETAGKTTLADRYRELFKVGVAANENGNEAIIKVAGFASPAMKNS